MSSGHESSSSSSLEDLLSAPPISLRHGIGKYFSRKWTKAQQLAQLEQSVEDYNAEYIASSTSGKAQASRHRRLICMPILDDTMFNPPAGMFSHNHVQVGDKVSLPPNYWNAIQWNQAEVPWLVSIKRIDSATSRRNDDDDNEKDDEEYQDLYCGKTVTGPRVEFRVPPKQAKTHEDLDTIVTHHVPLQNLDQVFCGPLDFRAPDNYIFVPLWVMRSLGLRPRDVVEVELCPDGKGMKSSVKPVPAGSMAKLRPHSSQFAKDIANPQAVLETELRHYSSLTLGSTIAFDYNSKRYWFDVVELRSAPRGEKVAAIKVQDCDIATDFMTPKDVMVEHKLKKKQAKLDRAKE